jgi:hypothetical protein
MFFSFAWGESVCLGAALDYFSGGWVEESQVLYDTQLFILQFYEHSFGYSCRGEMVLLFSVHHGVRRLSMG